MKKLSALIVLGLQIPCSWAQLAIPNPVVQPNPTVLTNAGPGKLAVPPAPPAPPGKPDGRPGTPELIPSAPPPSGSMPGTAPTMTPAKQAVTGLYVSTILGSRAVLRGPVPQVAGMGAMPGALPSMTPNPTGMPQAGAAGAQAVGQPRQVSYTVRDGESFFLTDTVEVQARVTDKYVSLIQRKDDGSKVLIFRGSVDSVAPLAPPKPTTTELVPKNQEYMSNRSVSTMNFIGGNSTASSGAAAPTAAVK